MELTSYLIYHKDAKPGPIARVFTDDKEARRKASVMVEDWGEDVTIYTVQVVATQVIGGIKETVNPFD